MKKILIRLLDEVYEQIKTTNLISQRGCGKTFMLDILMAIKCGIVLPESNDAEKELAKTIVGLIPHLPTESDKARMQIKTKDCKTCANQNETSGEDCYECIKGIYNHYKPITCERCANAKDYSEDGFYCKVKNEYCRADVSCEKLKPITDEWVEDLD